ncbi:hypothetical protein B0H10DRAFT_2161887 [Mycena sp. CBHHK59/15]|nr:hypothetical protein B0H10DRAFT_2161887 [Mycena sp. CBHHK59/15]
MDMSALCGQLLFSFHTLPSTSSRLFLVVYSVFYPTPSDEPPLFRRQASLGPSERRISTNFQVDFWFHDGSIVLLVGSLMFRVHQTVLSTHSEVFAGLFIIPQPPATAKGQEMIEGCHVVQLHDNPEDFIELLKGIYHPSHFETSPDELGDMLSSKYLIVSLRQRCTSILKSRFPVTFADYNVMISNPHRKHYKSDDVMRVVLLAQECNVLEILPYAYYCVARMGLTRIVSAAETDISWKEKALCLMSLSHSFLFAFQPAPSCQTPQCGLARGPQKEWRVLEAARSPNPLKQFVRWQSLNVCRECIVHAQAQHQAGREEVWLHLPVIFELPAWDELREQA